MRRVGRFIGRFLERFWWLMAAVCALGACLVILSVILAGKVSVPIFVLWVCIAVAWMANATMSEQRARRAERRLEKRSAS